jgi:hypothetical protein
MNNGSKSDLLTGGNLIEGGDDRLEFSHRGILLRLTVNADNTISAGNI